MPIKEEDIQVGKCYRTRGGEKDSEKYTVLNITRGTVTYQSWTTDPNSPLTKSSSADSV